MKVVVFSPHPDDEVLGVGGTMARLAHEGHELFSVIVTKGDSPMFDSASVKQLREEAITASKILGVKTIFLEDFPAALMDTIPHAQLNEALSKVLKEIGPELIFTPVCGDLHLDHRKIFDSVLIAARPSSLSTVKAICAYETLSETNWYAPPLTPGFMPNMYVDISGFLEKKLQAMESYQSQLRAFPHERSLESLKALAELRGTAVGFRSAEAFVLLRSIYPADNAAFSLANF